MTKYLLLIICCSLSISAFAQTSFDRGYFITNEGQKSEVFIKNLDWKSNPTQISYKEADDSKTLSFDISQVKEFGVGSYLKFVRATVNIDYSSDHTTRLDYSRTPNFSLETVFLKVILEGKASLYQFKAKNMNRIFYSVGRSSIEQLIYRKFLIGKSVIVDKKFQDQLKLNLKCESITEEAIDETEFTLGELVRLVDSYNLCSGVETVFFKDDRKKDLFNFSLKTGIRSANFDVRFDYNGPFSAISSQSNFKGTKAFSFGTELELTLPYNNNKWAVVIEPTYSNYKVDGETRRGNPINIEHSLLEIPLGLRYKAFLSPKNVAFINLSVVYSITFDETFEYGTSGVDYIFEPSDFEVIPGLIFGMGYSYNKKLSLESRITTKNQFFGQDQEWFAKYNYISFVIGYSLF